MSSLCLFSYGKIYPNLLPMWNKHCNIRDIKLYAMVDVTWTFQVVGWLLCFAFANLKSGMTLKNFKSKSWLFYFVFLFMFCIFAADVSMHLDSVGLKMTQHHYFALMREKQNQSSAFIEDRKSIPEGPAFKWETGFAEFPTIMVNLRVGIFCLLWLPMMDIYPPLLVVCK